MASMEFRAGVELRGVGKRLHGYASVFNTEARISSLGRSFRERVSPGAFRATLSDKHDICCLVDHDPGQLIGRTGSGTLRLAEDSRGLQFELDAPDTNLGRDLLALAQRNDLGGMSIGFRVAPGGEAWPADDLRELRMIDLLEISIAQAWPAYPDTSVAVRHRQAAPRHELSAPARRRRILDML